MTDAAPSRRFALLRKFEELTGYTPNAAHQKIKRGVWVCIHEAAMDRTANQPKNRMNTSFQTQKEAPENFTKPKFSRNPSNVIFFRLSAKGPTREVIELFTKVEFSENSGFVNFSITSLAGLFSTSVGKNHVRQIF